MITIIAIAVGAIIGSFSKSIFEIMVPNSITNYLGAKNDLKIEFNKLYREASKLHRLLSAHRVNVINDRLQNCSNDYYLNIIYCFYKLQSIIKLIEETSEETFVRLPRKYHKFNSLLRFVNKSINSSTFFSTDENFTYQSSNTVSQTSIDKAICFLIKDDSLSNKKVVINILEFETLLEDNKIVKREVENLIVYLKQMTNYEYDYSFIRLHIIIYSLRLLNSNIETNNVRDRAVKEHTTNQNTNNFSNLKLKEILSEKSFDLFSKDINIIKKSCNITIPTL